MGDMKSEKSEIKQIISQLITSKKENDYYDFKNQWHNKNEKLLHDIICMANVITHEGDRYIIIGISDKFEISGISNDRYRKNQQNVIDLIKNYDFNGDYRPDIKVETITFENKQVDVIIIKDKPYKPYFLRKSPTNREIFPIIYTRTGDTNTPVDSSADYNLIEKMFEERFGISKTPFERMKLFLLDYQNWDEIDYIDDKDITQYYYNKFPEFTIRYWIKGQESSKWSEKDCRGNFFTQNTIEFLYHSTVLKRDSIHVSKDGRLSFMLPSFSKSFYHNNIPYFIYYDFKNSIMSNSKDFINKLYGISLGDHIIEINSYRFIEFENKEKQELFYSEDNQKIAFQKFLTDSTKELYENINTSENDAIQKEFRSFIYDYYQEWKDAIKNENYEALNG